MADRINVTTGAASGGRGPVGPRAARFIVAGQTQFGPTTPVVVSSMSDFQRLFGARSGGANVYDAAEFFFGNNGGELVVQRAYGPSAVKATVSLSTGAIVVTARYPGAYYNAWTAAYTAASKTLTIVKGARTVTYTGADAASLQSAASVDPDLVVTVTSLPGSNVSATNLATGTDDFANVVWATVLGNITNAVGSGAMAVPGVNAANAALAAAATPRRVALLTPNQNDAASAVVTAQGAIAAGNKQNASYVYTWGTVLDGTGGYKVIDGTIYAGTLRSRAISVYGLGASALTRAAHTLVKGFTPLVDVDDATHTSLLNAGVITIRTLPNAVGVDVWATAEGVNANPKLQALQFRDMINAVADLGGRALDGFVGLPATPAVLDDARAAVAAVLDHFTPWLVGGDGVGYRASVSAGDVSDSRIAASCSLRFSEEIGFVDFVIVSASADQNI